MAHVIVTDLQIIIGSPYAIIATVLDLANEQFGNCASAWMKLNLLAEENRPLCDGMHIL